MAAAPPPMPPPSAPPPGGGAPDSGAPPGGAAPPTQDASTTQANSLQAVLGKFMNLVQTLGQQNILIQPEMEQIAQIVRQAFVKTLQAAQPQAQQAPPPGQ